MTPLHNTFWTIVLLSLIASLLRYCGYWLRMARQPKRLTRERAAERVLAASVASDEHDRLAIHYVIPAYRETDTLPETFRALRRSIEHSGYRSTITIVTSVLETSAAGEADTYEVAMSLCEGVPSARVVVDRSPSPSMAASFNTGIRVITRDLARDSSHDYVVVYNADSTARVDSTQALGDTLLARGWPAAAQINFVSLRNLHQMTGLGKWYAIGAAYYQTRWALGFEIDLHRKNSRPVRPRPLGHSYHLKGHGLALRLDVARTVGGFSTETPCEDLELGFRLSMLRVPVHAVPLLEDTEHPATVRSLVAQKRYWFSGMIDVLQFHKQLSELRRAQPFRFELQRLVFLYRSAACFLLAPVPAWFLIVGGITLGYPGVALLPMANAAISAGLIRRVLHSHDPSSERLTLSAYAMLPIGILIWSLTRNVGPIQYLGSVLMTRDRARRLRATHRQHVGDSEG